MASKILVQFVLIFVFFMTFALTDGSGCTSYCDGDGYYQKSQDCDPEPYCCGNKTTRYCCYNESLDITGIYEGVYPQQCHNSWWIFHWQVALGMLGTVIVLLAVTACCCQCCNKNSPNRQRNRQQNNRTRGTSDISVIDVEDNDSNPTTSFDPNSPFAFVPPAYESLPKDPPSYQTIFGGLEGTDNPAYQEDIEMAVLPPYSEHDNSNGYIPQIIRANNYNVQNDQQQSEIDNVHTCRPTEETSSHGNTTGDQQVVAPIEELPPRYEEFDHNVSDLNSTQSDTPLSSSPISVITIECADINESMDTTDDCIEQSESYSQNNAS